MLYFSNDIKTIDKYLQVCYRCFKDGEVVYPVPSVPGIYASSFGRIFRDGQPASIRVVSGLYDERMVNIRIDGKRRLTRVHRLIAEAFHGAAQLPELHVNHKNHNRLDNRPENLEWMLKAQNAVHSTGKSNAAHYSDHELDRLVQWTKAGYTQKQIAEKLGRSLMSVKRRAKHLVRVGIIPKLTGNERKDLREALKKRLK